MEGSKWAYVLQERLKALDFYAIQVRGISHRKILLTFEDREDVDNINTQELLKIFSCVKQPSYIDLVIPRVTWIWCDGLPIIAWNKETWKSILGNWGYLLTEQVRPLQNAMFQGLRLCISTNKVEKIDETLKVLIEDKRFWIKIKEIDSSQVQLVETIQRPTKIVECNEIPKNQAQHTDSTNGEDLQSQSSLETGSDLDLNHSENSHISYNIQENRQILYKTTWTIQAM